MKLIRKWEDVCEFSGRVVAFTAIPGPKSAIPICFGKISKEVKEWNEEKNKITHKGFSLNLLVTPNASYGKYAVIDKDLNIVNLKMRLATLQELLGIRKAIKEKKALFINSQILSEMMISKSIEKIDVELTKSSLRQYSLMAPQKCINPVQPEALPCRKKLK